MAAPRELVKSNRDLWQFITGSSVLRPKELIGQELKRNQSKLLEGLLFFKIVRTPEGQIAQKLKDERKLHGVQLEFVQKISKFLALDEVQSHDLYQGYLIHDYRGARTELQDVLSSERHIQSLLLKIRDYYHSERLYLIRCINHILSYWVEERHPYVGEYNEFTSPLYDNQDFINKISEQYDKICDEPAPTWESRGNIMNERHASTWMIQNLREQCELLETMLLYYRSTKLEADKLLSLASKFKKQGFGVRQTNKHLLDKATEPLIARIGFLQVLLIIEGVDLEDMMDKMNTNSIMEHHVFTDSVDSFKSLDSLMCSLGDSTSHGPLLLMWTAVRQMMGDAEGALVTKKLGTKALNLNTFSYILAAIHNEPFNGKTVIASTCHSLVYGLFSVVLSCFHESSLGDGKHLVDVAAALVKHPILSEELWEKGLTEGIGTLLQSAVSTYPLRPMALLQLCASLGEGSKQSALQTVELLQNLSLFTEHLDNRAPVKPTRDRLIWRLNGDWSPYRSASADFVIPAGTCGQHCPQLEQSQTVVQWELQYDAWDVFVCQVRSLLSQAMHGAGLVETSSIEEVTMICKLIQALLTSDPVMVKHTVRQLSTITDLLYQVIQRFCHLPSPPLELLSACIGAITGVAKLEPQQVWHNLQQTGLLPFLTENIDNFSEAASGSGLNSGAYGSILAGRECAIGEYPVTLDLLKLIASLVQPLHKAGKAEELMACVLFISREIFPVFHKWRYYKANSKQTIGQRCLEIFHKILNILSPDSTKKGVCLRDVCVYNLLFTESGRALLDIIGAGVDVVETALAAQGSAREGLGVELIQLIRMAFSVLNLLLLLRSTDTPPSPVEHCLSVQPASWAHRHIVATIAQYMFHRHNPRLPTLATVLLKRLAMVFPMSILACLGNDAEAIGDIYLARLQASTEDIQLKVVILEFLGTCVETQPGLLEMFLNTQPDSSKLHDRAVDKDKPVTTSKDRSCLETVLSLIEDKKQGTFYCPSELLCAASMFLHAIWLGRRETAMATLRKKPGFWHRLCLSLTRELPQPADQDVHREVLSKEIRTCANILHILAQELHAVNSSKLEENLNNVISEILSSDRMLYWSEYLRGLLVWSSETTEAPPDIMSEHDALQLLMAWRNFLLVLSTVKIQNIEVSAKVKEKLLNDILRSLESQFVSNMTVLHVRIASVSSAFYFTLLKHWVTCISDRDSSISSLENILMQTCANCETLIPSVQIGILGSLSLLLQHIRTNSIIEYKGRSLSSLVDLVCSLLQQSTYQLKPARKHPDDDKNTDEATVDIKLKLQITCICLLEELIVVIDSADTWMPILKQHSIIQCLLSSVQLWMEAQEGARYIQAVVMLFLSLSRYPQAAEALTFNGLAQHMSLPLVALCSRNDATVTMATAVVQGQDVSCNQVTWCGIYRLTLSLMSTLLGMLRYNFLQDALNFVGIHQDRLCQCLRSVGVSLRHEYLLEAVESCRFIAQLAHFRREWRLHLPQVINNLMTSVCLVSQRCVSLLIRPRLLQHVLEKKSCGNGAQLPDKLTMTPLVRRLSQQSSTDDAENLSQEVLDVQNLLLEVLCHCLVALRQFSPNLCEVLLDQSVDVSEFEPLLLIVFSTPSVEQDSHPTFGMLVSCISYCHRLLAKNDPKASPVKGQPVREGCQVKKSLVTFAMENALMLIMSQAARYLKDPDISVRDKQLLKRELSAELNSFLQSVQRYLRRGPTSPSPGSSHLASPQNNSKSLTILQTSFSAQEHSYFRLVDVFLKNVLR